MFKFLTEHQFETQLTIFDIGVLIFYFTLLIAVGFYSMYKSNRSTIKGYFLANRQMSWLFIGASLFATNIGAEHFIGLASSGAAKGKLIYSKVFSKFIYYINRFKCWSI